MNKLYRTNAEAFPQDVNKQRHTVDMIKVYSVNIVKTKSS